MKTLVLTACVAVSLLGAGDTWSQAPTHTAPITIQPSTAIDIPAAKRILIDSKLLAATAEGIYLKKLTAEFIKRCTGKAVGCAIAAVGPNGMWSEGAAGDARRALDGSPRKMTANDKFTMASVSKTFTGLALQRQLYGKRISIDSPIGPYLPKDWETRTKAVGNVTFRQLLTHTSGLPCNGIFDDELKTCLAIAKPVPSPFAYKNGNFALMRILIPQINGGASPTQYANLYRDYVNQVVFAPAGLPLMQCKPTDALPALSYKSSTANKWDFSNVMPGEIWGDMSDVCGSQGWYLSALQMARTMRTIMTPDKILPASLVERMKKDNLAVYFSDHGNGLQSWSHGGIHPGDCTKDYCNQGEINTLIIHFNNGVSAGVIINSPYGAGGVGGDYFGDLIASVKAAG